MTRLSQLLVLGALAAAVAIDTHSADDAVLDAKQSDEKRSGANLRASVEATNYCVQCHVVVKAFQEMTDDQRANALENEDTLQAALTGAVSGHAMCSGSYMAKCNFASTAFAFGNYHDILTKHFKSCKVNNGEQTVEMAPCPAAAMCAAKHTGLATFDICDVDPKHKLVI